MHESLPIPNLCRCTEVTRECLLEFAFGTLHVCTPAINKKQQGFPKSRDQEILAYSESLSL